ncbi:peptidyl-prolyl cis-trans isomerase [Bacteroides graminisolvens]|uniref:peptidyl-prolyl cis-trans isomerase n=1 Tax=Bacteroides graminisolvens TaxID=477666 RepID=UPI0023F1DFA7|nr:peptidyl-prolyl cis-trans isomerase [Bacteroides graminisolvens]
MRFFLFAIILFSFFSCSEKQEHKGKTPLVEVNGMFLYKEDVVKSTPVGLSAADSLRFVKDYIRKWSESVLLYEKAKNNIPDNEEIERMVNNYKRDLIVNAYQSELLNQKLNADTTNQALVDYYEINKGLFVLEEPVLKGLFIKVPLHAPQLVKVHQWYQKDTPETVDHLEKYSLQNAVSYEYFYDKWVSASEVLEKLPQHISLTGKRKMELKDTAYHYFLNVTDFLDKGELAPFDFVQVKVKEMLMNHSKQTFIKELKENLYQKAVENGEIINY